jgi:hypothetical protein
MAIKTMAVQIDGQELQITIRRVKKREFKALVRELASKGDEIADFFKADDFLDKLPGFIEEFIEYACDTLILPFVGGITAEHLDEMDMVEIRRLGKELLLHNHIDPEAVMGFLRPGPVARRVVGQALSFGGEPIPA